MYLDHILSMNYLRSEETEKMRMFATPICEPFSNISCHIGAFHVKLEMTFLDFKTWNHFCWKKCSSLCLKDERRVLWKIPMNIYGFIVLNIGNGSPPSDTKWILKLFQSNVGIDFINESPNDDKKIWQKNINDWKSNTSVDLLCDTHLYVEHLVKLQSLYYNYNTLEAAKHCNLLVL